MDRVLVLCVLTCSSVVTQNTLTGHKETQIKSIVNSLFDGSYANRYNSQYSPPEESQNGTSPKPTVVRLSVENFRVLGFNEKSKVLAFAADIVEEYVDRRLTYEAPKGIKYIDVQAYGGNSAWSPSLTVPHAPVSNAFGPDVLTDDDSKYIPKVLVGPQGHIYRKFGVYRQLRGTSGDSPKITKFLLEISEERNPIEDVQLRWKDTTSPLSLTSSLVELLNGDAYHLIAKSGNTSCSRMETLGYFGREEFSCVQVPFSLSST